MRCMIGLRFIGWFGRDGLSKSRVAERLGMSRKDGGSVVESGCV